MNYVPIKKKIKVINILEDNNLIPKYLKSKKMSAKNDSIKVKICVWDFKWMCKQPCRHSAAFM